jgi:predicted dehydrogenase
MKTIRWGMIGCGAVAEGKCGPALYRVEHSQLVVVADRHADRAQGFAQRHGIARWYDNAEAILRAPDIDAVYVATPTDSHYDYTLRCAAAGKPVLVEKPMAMNAAQCREMIAACEKAGVPLWVAYYRRALPRFVALRDLVQGGAIGEVRMVVTHHFQQIPPPEQMRGAFWGWRLDAKRSGGGIFFEAVGHTLDILDYVLGPIEGIRSFASNHAGAYEGEDIVSASYRFPSGVLYSGAWCFTADFDDEYNEIIGSKGRIRFSTFPPLKPGSGSQPVPMRVMRDHAVEEVPIADPPYVHQPLVQSIVDEMNGIGHCPSTPQSALRTAQAIETTLAEYVARRSH